MDKRERYIVCLMDGTQENVLAYNFREVVDQFGEDEIWQITKMFYEEAAE